MMLVKQEFKQGRRITGAPAINEENYFINRENSLLT
jgi:hypothetical protein